MILSIAQCCIKPHQGIFILPSFHPTTKGFLVEFWVGMKMRHTCITYFAKSKTGPQGDASHTLWSRRVSVWNFYKVPNSKIFLYSFDHESLFFGWMPFIWKYGLSLFLYFFFFSFLHALWHAFFSLMPFGMDIFFLFLLFFLA